MTLKRMKIIISILLIVTSCEKISSETVKVIGLDGSIKIVKFDINSTTINLSKTIPKIKTIKGLSKFKRLKKLSISFSDLRNTDFTFLKEIKDLRILELTFATLSNLDFISNIPSLVVFSCNETIGIDNLRVINLQNNSRLEYFGFFIENLQDIPEIKNVPKSLKYVDFNYSIFNKISLKNLYLLSSYKDVNYIFSKDIEACMKKLNLDINLFDGESNEYDSLLKQYSVY